MLVYLQGLSAFAIFFGMGVGFVLVFLAIYVHLTPHREIALIRGGNVAAALALAGALVGYCLPLAGALAGANAPLDLAIWASVAMAAQVVAYVLSRLLVDRLPARIEAGEMSAAIAAASVHVGIGLLNAAAMSY
jgi:putative membrane protein